MIRRARSSEFRWIWAATALLFAASAVVAPDSVSATSLRLMTPFAGVLAIASIGQALVVRQRGIDLTVPGLMSLSGLMVSKVAAEHAVAPTVAILVTLAVCALVGLGTGAVVTRLGITPLIATLAVNALLAGAIQSYSGGVPVKSPAELNGLVLGTFLGLSNVAFVALAVMALASAAISWTVVGRRFVAVGESAETARAAGIRVRRYRVATYAIAAVCFGLAGILLASYVQTAVPNAGDSYLLPVIAAVVVGGTPFSGGRGSVVATVVAAVFLSQLLQLVLALGAPSSVQFLVQSAAIAAATALRHVGWSRLTAGLARRRPQTA